MADCRTISVTVDLVDAKCPHCDMKIHGEYIEEICEEPYNVILLECPHCKSKYSTKVMLRIVPQEPDEEREGGKA